jgi:membrane protein implicated in regulation of membrane protease activity
LSHPDSNTPEQDHIDQATSAPAESEEAVAEKLETEEAGRKPTRLERAVITACKLLACVIALGLWCTVGLAVWVAIIARTIAAVTLHMMIALIAGDEVDNSGRAVEATAIMWPRGFHAIIDTLWYSRRQSGERRQAAFSYGHSLREMAFAIVLYGLGFLVVSGEFVGLLDVILTEQNLYSFVALVSLIIASYFLYRTLRRNPTGSGKSSQEPQIAKDGTAGAELGDEQGPWNKHAFEPQEHGKSQRDRGSAAHRK